MKRLFIIFLILLPALPYLPAEVHAQKEFKALRNAIKASKYNDACKEVAKLEKDSIWMRSPHFHSLAFTAYKQAYDAQNEKLYLHQQADTAAYFKAIRGMFNHAQMCEKAEYRLEKEGIKPRFRATHANYLRKIMPNLLKAATFCYENCKYGEAEEAAALLLSSASDSAFWEKSEAPTLSQLEKQVAALIYVQGNYMAKNYGRMFRYSDLALTYAPARSELLEELATARLCLGDSTAYCDSLVSAIHEFPERSSLYTRLHSYYLEKQEYEALLEISQFINGRDSSRLDVKLGKAYALYQLDRKEELIAASLEVLELDPENPSANYYLGRTYSALAQSIPVPIRRGNNENYKRLVEERKEWYKKALMPMEIYRKAKPENAQLWAPLLYDIYLNLNMGKEFEEISKLIP